MINKWVRRTQGHQPRIAVVIGIATREFDLETTQAEAPVIIVVFTSE
jgi:hypothetical protein